MCQIIGYYNKHENSNEKDLTLIKNALNDKGGDEFSYFSYDYVLKSLVKFVFSNANDLIESLRKENENSDYYLIFSRQTPALEIANSKNSNKQPYNLDKGTSKGKVACIHGTIPFVDDNYEVDTDIILDYKVHFDSLPGSWIKVEFSKDTKTFKILNKGGLGYYIHKMENGVTLFSMSKMSDLDVYVDYKNSEIKTCRLKNTTPEPERIIRYVLFSGGLDSTCETLKIIKTYIEEEINKENSRLELRLIYFDYGTMASKYEIESIHAFLYELEKLNLKDPAELRVVDANAFFKSYVHLLGYNPNDIRLTSPDSIGGGIDEAEAGSSYFPLRNTLMVNLVAGIIEKDKTTNIYDLEDEKTRFDIHLGLNLDDGMAANMLDNTNGWLNSINQTVKLSGANTRNINVCSNYVNKTKLNMLKDIQNFEYSGVKFKDIIKKSFSCYFPKDGKPCGECGSCLLRKSSMERSGIDAEEQLELKDYSEDFIIFLDVDGVLNIFSEYYHTLVESNDFEIEPHLVKRLDALLTKMPEAKIIVSSSWLFDDLISALKNLGFTNIDKILHSTIRSQKLITRGGEISATINAYNINNYVIIDDEVIDIYGYVRPDSIIGVNMEEGLSNENLKNIIDKYKKYKNEG